MSVPIRYFQPQNRVIRWGVWLLLVSAAGLIPFVVSFTSSIPLLTVTIPSIVWIVTGKVHTEHLCKGKNMTHLSLRMGTAEAEAELAAEFERLNLSCEGFLCCNIRRGVSLFSNTVALFRTHMLITLSKRAH